MQNYSTLQLKTVWLSRRQTTNGISGRLRTPGSEFLGAESTPVFWFFSSEEFGELSKYISSRYTLERPWNERPWNSKLVCSWKIHVWIGPGLFWGLQQKLGQKKNSGNILVLWTAPSNSSEFCKWRIDWTHVRSSIRWIAQEGVRISILFNFKTNITPTFVGCVPCVLIWNIVCYCRGHTSLSESSQRRSKLLPAVQTWIFQEQTKIKFSTARHYESYQNI